MKKLLSLTITFILVLSILSSCVLFAPVDTGSKTDTKTESSTETNTQTGTQTSTSTQTGTSTNTNTSIDQAPEDGVYTSRFMFTFAYYHIHDTLTGEAYATLLCYDSYVHIDYERPLDITAGDMLIVEHTGVFVTQETYPGTTYLHNGEVISYRFEYSEVYKLTGNEINSESIRNQYDFRWGDEYVILDSKGNFVSIDEYEGDTLYLVLDKERAEQLNSDKLMPSWDTTKTPIACALAYNPRNPSEWATDAELRDCKVEINLDVHSDGLDQVEEEKEDISRRYAGYIGYNESGNEYIAYAPNCYSYFALVRYSGEKAEVWEQIESIGRLAKIEISIVNLSDGEIMAYFADFDEYCAVQEELLNTLSALDAVEKIEVGYLDNKEDVRQKSYDVYKLNFTPGSQSRIITSYSEFTEMFDLSDDKNASLLRITENTFNNYYVVYDTDFGYGHCVDEISVRDARLVDGNLFYTLYEYYFTTNEHCLVAVLSQALIVIPKADLGEAYSSVSTINTMHIDMYVADESDNQEGSLESEIPVLRDQKVEINLDYHSSLNDKLEEELYGDKRHAGYIGYNENGNEYIAYAPNYYQYFVLVSYDGGAYDIGNVISKAENSLYPKSANEETGVDISIIELSDNQIMVVFPNFDTYSYVEEELLNGLSAINGVKKIDVGYIDTQNNKEPVESYKKYENVRPINSANDILITSYDQLLSAFDLSNEYNSALEEISEDVFEENYLFFIRMWLPHSQGFGEAYDVYQARMIDNSLYLTIYNSFPRGMLSDCMESLYSALLIIPKSDLGSTVPGDYELKTIRVDVYFLTDVSTEDDTLDEYPN